MAEVHRLPARPGRAGTARVRARLEESVAAHAALLHGALPELIADVADLIANRLAAGGKVVLFGNGGSAADATHLAAEFVGRFRFDRAPLPALSLSDNGSSVSGIGNDYGYDEVFARQVIALGVRGDVAIGLTTSGSSENVVAGLRAAQARELTTVAITGALGGPATAWADVSLRMPAQDTARVQECSMVVGHLVCELVEQSMFAGS